MAAALEHVEWTDCFDGGTGRGYRVSQLSGAAAWDDPSSVELVFTGLGSPWTESRCTLLNVSAAGRAGGGALEVRVKQPCFGAVQHKPCGQGTSAGQSSKSCANETSCGHCSSTSGSAATAVEIGSAGVFR